MSQTCKRCSSKFEPKAGPGRPRLFCSSACTTAATRDVCRAAFRPSRAGQPISQIEVKTRLERRRAHHRAKAKAVACRICNASFSPIFGFGIDSICVPCKPAAATRRRRVEDAAAEARLRRATIEFVDPIVVLSRDDWRCYLCGCSTPPDLRGSYHPQAPEVEHVMPLARGGDHSYANTRCACRQCNQRKAAKLPSLTQET